MEIPKLSGNKRTLILDLRKGFMLRLPFGVLVSALFAIAPKVHAREVALRQPLVIAPEAEVAAGKSQSWKFRAPSHKPDEVVVLRFFLRMHTEGYGGCNYAMKTTVNGKPITPGPRARPLLLSQPRSIHLLNWEAALPMFSNDLWMVMYAPDFQPKQVVGGDDGLYEFDVTDLVRSDDDNEVTLSHHGEVLSTILNAPVPFMIKDLSIGTVLESEARKPLDVGKPLPFVKGVALRSTGYEVTLPAGGGMEVRVGRAIFHVNSRFSFPKAGWNTLSPQTQSSGEVGWKPRVELLRAGVAEVSAEGAIYRLRRVITCEDHRVVVRDEFTNKTADIVGMRLRNEVNTAGQQVEEVRLGGNDQVDEVSPSLDNPTAFVRLRNAGLGLLAEDDVYRVQSFVYNESPEVGVGSNEFGLGPGKSYALRWAIYPTASGEAFDFINQVRRDWGVNDITIDGPGVWLEVGTVEKWSDEALASWLALRSAKIVLLGPWLITLDIPHIGGYEKLKPQFLSAIERLHRARPGVKVICLIHPTMNFCKPGDVYDSDAYKDSFILNPDGTHFWSDYYSKAWFNEQELKEGWRNYCNFAVPGNSYYDWLMRWIDRALNELGADGIYSDEFNHFNNVSPTTYGAWDGHSVKVDPKTFVADTKKLFARLIYKTEATQQAIVDRVIRNGGLFIANSHPGLASLQRRKFLAFCEIADLQNCFHTQLFTPIGLGWSPGYGSRQWGNEADVFQNLRDQVEHGALYYFYGPPELKHETAAGKMFPFTVLDLRPGILTGRERIITTRSGRYGWKNSCNVRVWYYDAQGTLLNPTCPVEVVPAGKRREVRVSEKGLVVIERVRR